MKVSLLQYTKDAREILLFSKKTRLAMSVDSFKEVMNLSEEDKAKELLYVFGTITGSFEFVDYTFLIEDVSRAFTHQLVRHRVGVSFAQQSQRTVDMSGFKYFTPENCKDDATYHVAMNQINLFYSRMIDDGIKPEDARGILPTNIYTNIMMKINLRALSEMLSQRLCKRTQKEFRDVAAELRRLVINIHPWADKVLKCYCDINGKCFFKNGKGCGKYGTD